MQTRSTERMGAGVVPRQRHLRSLCNYQFSRGGCSGLRRRNLEGGFVLYLERHRARDKAFLGGCIVQMARDVLIRAGPELGVRPQRDAFELPGTVRPLDLYAGGVVAVCHDHDPGVGAKVQIPELMTGGKRSDEQLRWIPSRRVAAEHRVGRTGYCRFALRANLMRPRIGAVRRRAGALIAGPVETNRIGVTLVCHELLREIAADVAFGSKWRFRNVRSMSLPPKADIRVRRRYVRFVPIADHTPQQKGSSFD